MHCDLVEFQNLFKEQLFTNQSKKKSNDSSNIFNLILKEDKESLDFIFKEFSERLQSFAKDVDIDHPCLDLAYDQIFSNTSDFSQIYVELFQLLKICKNKNINIVLNDMVEKYLEKYKSILSKIDSPLNNRTNIKLLKDEALKYNIRSCKKMQIIDLDYCYKKGNDCWITQPNNFNKLVRLGTAYEDDIIAAEKKIKRYISLGCITLSEEVQKSIELYKENIDQSYYGFNRVTVTNASIILAKSLGYEYSFSSDYQIVIDRDFFTGYNFLPYAYESKFKYQPRIYPLQDLESIIPEESKQIIDFLEHFPEANGKSIFDNFGIIVPGINFPQEKDHFYSYVDFSGTERNYSDKNEALKELDLILIKHKYYNCIIVGEKDGKCYFISYLGV